MHVLAARGDVQHARQIPLQPDASAELHAPLAHPRRQIIEAIPALVEMDRAVDGIERVGHREVTDAAVGDRRAPGKQRVAQRPVDCCFQLRAARPADLAVEPLQDPEVRVAHRLQRDPLTTKIDGARDAQPRAVPDELQLVDPDEPVIEREMNRRGVPQRVVEQAHLDRVDGAVDEQMIEVGQLADDPDCSAGDGGGERRQLRHEQTRVRIERAVVETKRDLGVRLRRQGDAAGAEDVEPRRRRGHFAAQLLAAHRERPGDLADPLFTDEQSVAAKPHVVARLTEGAAAAGREFDEARERRRVGKREGRDLFGRNAAAVRVEGVRRVPPDERGAGQRPAVLVDGDAVEPHACAIEPQRGGRFLERLGVRGPVVDRHAAEADRMLVFAGEVEFAGERPGHQIVVELKGVAQALEVAPHDAEARVDLLPAIVARIPEREHAVGVNLGRVMPHHGIGHLHVRVLDDDVAVAGSPPRVPRAQILTAERAFHPRPLEAARHHAVELAASAERDGAGRGSEIGDDAGQHLIAFLPVAARHVKREARVLAPRRGSLKRDVRALGGEAAGIDVDALGIEAVGQLARDRQMHGQRGRRERTPFVARVVRIGRTRGRVSDGRRGWR